MIVGQEVTAAMKLQDIYYGNVIPCQHDVRRDSDYAKRSLELLEMCDTLEKRLSAECPPLLTIPCRTSAAILLVLNSYSIFSFLYRSP